MDWLIAETSVLRCRQGAHKMTLKELTQIVLEIRDNHLEHIKQDMDKMDSKIDKVENKVDKMDGRLWWILAILVGATLIPVITNLVSH